MKKSYVLLKKILSQNPKIISLFRENGTAVLCRNTSTGKTKRIMIRALHDNDAEFWEKSGKPWSFYVEREEADAVLQEWEERRKKGVFAKVKSTEGGTDGPSASGVPPEGEDGTQEKQEGGEDPEEEGSGADLSFGLRFTAIQGLSLEEKEKRLEQDRERLCELEKAERVPDEEKIQTLMDVTADSALVNKATVEETFSMDNADAQLLSTKLVSQTDDIVDAVTRILSRDYISNDLFSGMMSKSDGTTVRHMTRVFLKSMSFFIHYNDKVNQSSLAHKIRTRFDQQYKRYYLRLFPGRHATEMSLAQAFEGGLQALSGEYLHNVAIGLLLHDIGKQEDIEYYEGDEAYNREVIIKHAAAGEAMLKDKTSYSDSAAYMAGFHHEYYNDKNGYGTYRGRLALAWKKDPSLRIPFAVTYSPESVRSCRALSFFPAKMLEIVDVYDALTDPDRKYKDPLSPQEALKMMRMEFVQRHVKLDPVLFDIFIDFLKSSGEIEA